jgi:hypothetical protein
VSSFDATDLYTGERMLLSRPARWMGNLPPPLAGTKGEEPVRGRLYLTSYRVVFLSEEVDRHAGIFSILLPSVRAVKAALTLWTEQIRVSSDRDDVFVVSGRKELVTAMEKARRGAEPERAEIERVVKVDPSRLGFGIER